MTPLFSRWRWNPTEKVWEVDQGKGWILSVLMKGRDETADPPKGGTVVTFEESTSESHWKEAELPVQSTEMVSESSDVPVSTEPTVKRGRGRPKGSKNKSTLVKEQKKIVVTEVLPEAEF